MTAANFVVLPPSDTLLPRCLSCRAGLAADIALAACGPHSCSVMPIPGHDFPITCMATTLLLSLWRHDLLDRSTCRGSQLLFSMAGGSTAVPFLSLVHNNDMPDQLQIVCCGDLPWQKANIFASPLHAACDPHPGDG